MDVVVVSYNSRASLRECIEPLAGHAGVHVTVVDNASSDRCLDVVADLPAELVALRTNDGFAAGCNAGWPRGSSPFVLFLNPDARIDPRGLERLAHVLEEEEHVGLVGPQIRDADGSLDYSQRRYPRLLDTYAQALFLHRVFPRAAWTDGVVRDARAYETSQSPEWVSGASMMVRRSLLEGLGGLDEGFFLYCEDVDLCRRVVAAGYEVRYVPEAMAIHSGGGSAPRPALFPVLAASRVRYARKYRPRALVLERAGLGLSALTHMVVARGGLEPRLGYARSLVPILSLSSGGRPSQGCTPLDPERLCDRRSATR